MNEGGKHIGRNLNGCARREGDEDQKGERRETKREGRENPNGATKHKEWRRRKGQLIGEKQKS